MASYANAHFALDGLRDAAAEMGGLGPRVLIVGPENAGKTSLTRMLSAYAMRSGQQPVVVNLDPREGMFAVPGTLSAAVLESIADVELGWGSSPTNGPTQIPVKLPLVYYYGMEEPEDRRDIYKALVTRLAVAVANRMEDGVETKRTGCFIDTPGSMSQGKDNHDIIQHVVAEFSSKCHLTCTLPSPYNSADAPPSQRPYRPRLRAPIQRHAASLRPAIHQQRQRHLCRQARQVWRLRRPRRTAPAAPAPGASARVLFRRREEPAESAHPDHRFRRRGHLPGCRA